MNRLAAQLSEKESYMRSFAVLIALTLGSGLVQADIELRSACGGFKGKSTKYSVVVSFESCPTAGTYSSRIWKGANQDILMSEILYDKVASTTRIWIGGIEVTGSNTPEELVLMGTILDLPEAAVVRELATDLKDLGLDPETSGMKGTSGNTLIYNTDSGLPIIPFQNCGAGGCCDSLSGCQGCCGQGCDHCYDVCTDACDAHDTCVTLFGHFSPVCIVMLAAAIDSFFDVTSAGWCHC